MITALDTSVLLDILVNDPKHADRSEALLFQVYQHRHDDQIGAVAMVSKAADDDGRSVLRRGLIGKRKRHEDDIPELIAGHSLRRRGCPRRGQKRVRLAG